MFCPSTLICQSSQFCLWLHQKNPLAMLLIIPGPVSYNKHIPPQFYLEFSCISLISGPDVTAWHHVGAISVVVDETWSRGTAAVTEKAASNLQQFILCAFQPQDPADNGWRSKAATDGGEYFSLSLLSRRGNKISEWHGSDSCTYAL